MLSCPLKLDKALYMIGSIVVIAGVDDGIVINSVQGVGDANLDPLVLALFFITTGI